MSDKYTNAERIHDYIYDLKPVINVGGLFSDGSEYYRIPQEPGINDQVKVRFRTCADNADEVYLIYNGEELVMSVEESDDLFDYYTAVIPAGEKYISYYFEVHSGCVTCYYNRIGVQKNVNPDYNFEICPGFDVPDWAKGAVFYQIYVDRFCNGDPSNDVLDNEYCYIDSPTRQVKDWYEYPANMDVGRFYGGDLQGVKDKLDYLQDLGVDVIYFNPLFVSPSNHKYDIQDYDYIDPHFGKIVVDEGECLPDGVKENKRATKYISRVTDKRNLEASNQFFAELVEEIHSRGMRVILDGVFNHCGSFNKWMDRECIYENQEGYEKGAYVSWSSPYKSFFKFYNEEVWPYNTTYDGWWGHDTLPKLNYEDSPKLVEYILNIAKKWVSPPYNVDGWRLDVAADLGHSEEYNHKFWRMFRNAVKEANPNAIVLAEHYGDPKPWLKGDQWDTVMNYDAFMEPLTWFFTGMEKHSDEFRGDLLGNEAAFTGAMRHHMASFLAPSLQVAMNELSNHDHSRFLTRTNHKAGRVAQLGTEAAEKDVNKAILREAVIMQMTWIGAPTIYYGDEAGLCGWTDPDNRRTYPWGREDNELIEFHRQLIRIHKDYQVFKTGSIMFLKGQYKLIGYGRFDENDKIVVMINSSDEVREADIPVWRMGIIQETRMARLMLSDREGYSDEAKVYPVVNGLIHVECPPMSGMIIKDIESIG